jgi:hypothetical protein
MNNLPSIFLFSSFSSLFSSSPRTATSPRLVSLDLSWNEASVSDKALRVVAATLSAFLETLKVDRSTALTDIGMRVRVR